MLEEKCFRIGKAIRIRTVNNSFETILTLPVSRRERQRGVNLPVLNASTESILVLLMTSRSQSP